MRREDNWDIVPEAAPLPGEIVLDKPSNGAFGTTDLNRMLWERGLGNLVVFSVASTGASTGASRRRSTAASTA